jgi:predicted PolB exonuclease-like 3'-5' exonuclease
MMEDRMQIELSEEEKSKDAFFERIARLSQEMVEAHGKDFSMGALVLGARWIAEGKADAGGKAPSRKMM